MAYLKAIIIALLAALIAGGVSGAGEAFTGALARLRAEEKQAVFSRAVSVATNNAAFLVLLFVPLAIVFVSLGRRWSRRRSHPSST